MQQQIRQPGEALGPEQGDVLVGHPDLAAGLAPLGLDQPSRHKVELRQQGLPVDRDAQLRQCLAPLAGFVPAVLAAGGDQLVGEKQGPLAFDVLELGQLLPLVVESAHVLQHGLMAVSKEALVAVGAGQLAADLLPGAGDEGRILDGPGGVADHREAGAVGLLAGRLPRQQAPQGASQPHDGVVGNGQATAAVAMGSVEVESDEGLEGGLHHAD